MIVGGYNEWHVVRLITYRTTFIIALLVLDNTTALYDGTPREGRAFCLRIVTWPIIVVDDFFCRSINCRGVVPFHGVNIDASIIHIKMIKNSRPLFRADEYANIIMLKFKSSCDTSKDCKS